MMKPKDMYAVMLGTLWLLTGIQPVLGIDIPSDTTVGTWVPGTRTYTLTQDVTEGLVIVEDNLTLNGVGHTVSGADAGAGDPRANARGAGA